MPRATPRGGREGRRRSAGRGCRRGNGAAGRSRTRPGGPRWPRAPWARGGAAGLAASGGSEGVGDGERVADGGGVVDPEEMGTALRGREAGGRGGAVTVIRSAAREFAEEPFPGESYEG